MSIGKNIAKYRKERKLTQEELGAKLGVTNQAVSKWESEVSMPDVMLLPEIADALSVTLQDLYGIAQKNDKKVVYADNFPSFCYRKLIEFFYHSATRVKLTSTDLPDEEQIDLLIKYLSDGFRIGCISNTQGAVIATGDFAFIDKDYKASVSEDIVGNDRRNLLTCLTNNNFRKVFYYQYKHAFQKSKETNTAFTFDEIMNGSGLTVDETNEALNLLIAAEINVAETEMETNSEKYIFLMSRALYVHAIYKLTNMLSETACWEFVRDTSFITDYVFEK